MQPSLMISNYEGSVIPEHLMVLCISEGYVLYVGMIKIQFDPGPGPYFRGD